METVTIGDWLTLFECHEEVQKRTEIVNFKVTEKELADLMETCQSLGLDKSEYLRLSVFIAKPFLLFIKKNVSFFLSLISRMHRDQ